MTNCQENEVSEQMAFHERTDAGSGQPGTTSMQGTQFVHGTRHCWSSKGTSSALLRFNRFVKHSSFSDRLRMCPVSTFTDRQCLHAALPNLRAYLTNSVIAIFSSSFSLEDHATVQRITGLPVSEKWPPCHHQVNALFWQLLPACVFSCISLVKVLVVS